MLESIEERFDAVKVVGKGVARFFEHIEHAHCGGSVKDAISPLCCFSKFGPLLQRRLVESEVLVIFEVVERAGVEIVHSPDVVATEEVVFDEVGPDEAGTSGDEHIHAFTTFSWGKPWVALRVSMMRELFSTI